ncbi:hypothetical protein MAPG_08405 [Magnaporthiopsis poae ATCC 64411]|uniref:GRF-like zinc ribbon domain-containing protein n=1 Tax=Magnaporthiopsis poae (strain ATCC 64411 / 73-15) TaxID=644358 RepID=A0A0C4E7A1_MAGP6|nr:hypothetical protein MAPG_08405 [Magnaporthiopsis poae ATCC 64411]
MMNILGVQYSQPTCRHCDGPTEAHTVKLDNCNYNAGRPYYRCRPCDSFSTFADDLGVQLGNPRCRCDLPSRQQLAGLEETKTVPRGLHYVCMIGRCDFREQRKDDNGSPIAVWDRSEILAMRQQKLI